MSLWNTIGSADLETANLSFPENAIAGFRADAENFTHLLYAHDIGIVFQHELVGIALRNS